MLLHTQAQLEARVASCCTVEQLKAHAAVTDTSLRQLRAEQARDISAIAARAGQACA